jgi:hypothetical protein
MRSREEILQEVEYRASRLARKGPYHRADPSTWTHSAMMNALLWALGVDDDDLDDKIEQLVLDARADLRGLPTAV